MSHKPAMMGWSSLVLFLVLMLPDLSAQARTTSYEDNEDYKLALEYSKQVSENLWRFSFLPFLTDCLPSGESHGGMGGF